MPAHYGVAMRTLAEIAALSAEVGRLLRARWWLLGTWFCLGWAGHQACLFASALLGSQHAVLANLAFVIGVVVRLAALVLMIHSLEPSLRFPRRGAPTAPTAITIPAPVYAHETALEATALAVGPFLAVYAVWGLIDDEVRALFVSNYTPCSGSTRRSGRSAWIASDCPSTSASPSPAGWPNG